MKVGNIRGRCKLARRCDAKPPALQIHTAGIPIVTAFALLYFLERVKRRLDPPHLIYKDRKEKRLQPFQLEPLNEEVPKAGFAR